MSAQDVLTRGEAHMNYAKAVPGNPADEAEMTLAVLSGLVVSKATCYAPYPYPVRKTKKDFSHQWAGPVRVLGGTFYRRCEECRAWRVYYV